MDILQISRVIIRGEPAYQFPLKHESGWVSDKSGSHVIDIRGWGMLSYHSEGEDAAGKLQDAFGEWVVRTLNEGYEKALQAEKSVQV